MSEPCERLDDWLAGQLDVVAHEAFERHLLGCARCRVAGRDRVVLEMVASGAGVVRHARWRPHVIALAAVGAVAALVVALVLLARGRPERWEVEAPVEVAGVRFTVGDVALSATSDGAGQVPAPAVRRGASSRGEPLRYAAPAEVSRQHGARALAAALVIANR